MIPFIDLQSHHKILEEDFVRVFRQALHTGGFIGGPEVEAFEEEFALFCGTRYCIGVNSGTDALRFALMAAGIRQNDIVITVPNTFVATTEAISQTGATPAFVDIDEKTFNMDPQKLGRYLGALHSAPKNKKRVKAIVPVHLYGQPADMDAILEIAGEYDLLVIEDACQAHGARYFSEKNKQWKRAGSMGLAAAFSFYPGKNLGAFGEAGAVTTDDDAIAEKVRMLRDHGQAKKYFHDIEGYNGRLDAIQAGVLRVKLKHLNDWNEQRRRRAYRYNELLGGVDSIPVPQDSSGVQAVYHLYVIRTRRRDELQKYLGDKNIATGLHYPLPLHLQRAYQALGYQEGDFPVSEKVAKEIISLPIYPELTPEQQEAVVFEIKAFFNGNKD